MVTRPNSKQCRLLVGVRQQRLAVPRLGAMLGDVAALAAVEAPPSVAAPRTPACPRARAVAVVLVTIASMAAAAAARPLLAAALVPTCLPQLLGEEQLLGALLDAVRVFLSTGILRHAQPADKLLH